MNTLRELVTEKTKYIPDNLWYEALHMAKDDIAAHKSDFNKKTKAEKLEYTAYTMAVYISRVKM